MKNQTWTIILIAVCLTALGAGVLEKTQNRLWTNRLYLPFFTEEPNRHTPIHTEGTYLPPTISKEITLTPENSPVIVKFPTRITATGKLTLTPGTQIFFHEYASLVIEGTLIAAGTSQKPITFTTNELHPQNQTWAGLIFAVTSRGTLTHTTITHASPGISCLNQSQVAITHALISRGNTGLLALSPNCTIESSLIQNVREGIIQTAPGNYPAVQITASRTLIKTITP